MLTRDKMAGTCPRFPASEGLLPAVCQLPLHAHFPSSTFPPLATRRGREGSFHLGTPHPVISSPRLAKEPQANTITTPDPRRLKFLLRDHVQCPSFSPPPPSKKIPPSSLAPEISQQLGQNNDGMFRSVCRGWGWEGTSCSPHL